MKLKNRSEKALSLAGRVQFSYIAAALIASLFAAQANAFARSDRATFNTGSFSKHASAFAADPSQKQESGNSTRKSKNAARKKSWKVGDRLEVESRAVWYTAEIVEISGDKYKIHYEGYPMSDDEWVDASRMRPIGGLEIEVECVYKLPGSTNRTARPSAELFKKLLFERHRFLPRKEGRPARRTPRKIAIGFVTFKIDVAYKNMLVPIEGRGMRPSKTNAPLGVTIYPLRTQYVICDEYRGQSSRMLHTEQLICYKDRQGEWACETEGTPKVTRID